MSIFLDSFARVQIINLTDRLDRRRDMAQELIKMGVDKERAGALFYNASRPVDPDGFPGIGVRGAFESHLNVLRQALADGVEHVLVMEDDLWFSPVLIQNQALAKELIFSQTWDFLYLGHGLPDRASTKAIDVFFSSEPTAYLHFYAVSKSVLPELVSFLETVYQRPSGHPEGGKMHVDGAMSFFRASRPALKTLFATPQWGGQRASRSDITTRWLDRIKILRAPLHLWRKIKNKRTTRGPS